MAQETGAEWSREHRQEGPLKLIQGYSDPQVRKALYPEIHMNSVAEYVERLN